MKEYIKFIIEDVSKNEITCFEAEHRILQLHEQAMKNFINEVIQATRFSIMQAENNLIPLIEKYK